MPLIIFLLFCTYSAQAFTEGNATPWSGAVDLGLDEVSGNSKSTSIVLGANAKRVISSRKGYPYGAFTSKLGFTYKNSSGVTSARNGFLNAEYNEFIRETVKLFCREKLSFDDFKDLDLRAEEILGLGKRVIDKRHIILELNIGISRIDSFYENSTSVGYFSIPLGYNLIGKITEAVTFTQEVLSQFSMEEFGQTLTTCDSELQIPMNGSWIVKFVHTLSHNSSPVPGKKNLDQVLSIRIGYTL